MGFNSTGSGLFGGGSGTPTGGITDGLNGVGIYPGFPTILSLGINPLLDNTDLDLDGFILSMTGGQLLLQDSAFSIVRDGVNGIQSLSNNNIDTGFDFANSGGTVRGMIRFNGNQGYLKIGGLEGGYYPAFYADGVERMRIQPAGGDILMKNDLGVVKQIFSVSGDVTFEGITNGGNGYVFRKNGSGGSFLSILDGPKIKMFPGAAGSIDVGLQFFDFTNTALGQISQNTGSGDVIIETHSGAGKPEIVLDYDLQEPQLWANGFKRLVVGSAGSISFFNEGGATTQEFGINGDLNIVGDIVTGNPSAGSANWRLGILRAGAVVVDTSRSVQIKVGSDLLNVIVST